MKWTLTGSIFAFHDKKMHSTTWRLKYGLHNKYDSTEGGECMYLTNTDVWEEILKWLKGGK